MMPPPYVAVPVIIYWKPILPAAYCVPLVSQAIDDATSEWAQHHAKRFIDTKAKVSTADCFAVWVGLSGVGF